MTMGSVAKSIKNMFNPPKMKMPKLPELPQMPDPDAPAARLASRKKMEERRERGRSGTIYTGGSYSNQNLGGTQ
jgi:hypothetical protein